MSQASKYGAGENPFPTKRKTAADGKGVVYFRTTTCTKCGADGEWRDTSPSGAHVQAITTGYRKMGWEMSERGKGTCPECLAKKRQKVGLSDLDKALGMNVSPLGVVYRKRPEPMDQSNPPRQATAEDYLTGPSPRQLQMSHVPTEQPVQVQEETPPTSPTTNRPDKYVRATMQTALLIRDQLVSVVERHADGYARYKEGFSDQIVAEAVAVACGHPVSPHSVAKLRRDLYGNMKTAPIPKSKTETITVTVDPNPELLATLATAHKEVALLKSELLTLSDMALELATRCGRIVEGK